MLLDGADGEHGDALLGNGLADFRPSELFVAELVGHEKRYRTATGSRGINGRSAWAAFERPLGGFILATQIDTISATYEECPCSEHECVGAGRGKRAGVGERRG